jgi:FkbM family methyltransferase
MSPDRGFIFRRIAPFAPCVFPSVGSGQLLISNKWQLASARDVFLSAHYWRLFEYLEHPPRLVVDLGAHCGHFIVVLNCIARERFGADVARYIAVEGLHGLLPSLSATLKHVGLLNQVEIVHGLVGSKSGSGYLYSGDRSRLDATVRPLPNKVRRGAAVPYIDVLDRLAEGERIDVLKIDIEGAEFELLSNYPDLFARSRLIAIELHGHAGDAPAFIEHLQSLGLRECSAPIVKQAERLMLFRNELHG